MSYAKGLPIMIVVEQGLKAEGLLDTGNDWFILSVKAEVSSLTTEAFNGVLASWKKKVIEYNEVKAIGKLQTQPDPAQMTIGTLIASIKPAHLWSFLVASVAMIIGAFQLGALLSK